MKKRTIFTIILGALTAAISGAMNIILFPIIEDGVTAMPAFDMNPLGYKAEQAREFLATISDLGRQTYLHIQLPLDFVYPIVYTAFFLLLIKTLADKKARILCCIAPVLLFISDYCENICTIKMLSSEITNDGFFVFTSAVTMVKSMLMYAVFSVIIGLAVIKFINYKKNKNGTV